MQLIDTLLDLHGPHVYSRDANHLLPWSTGELVTEFMEQRAVELADVIVSPSQFMINHVTNKLHWNLPSGDRVKVIPNVLLEDSFSDLPTSYQYGMFDCYYFHQPCPKVQEK